MASTESLGHYQLQEKLGEGGMGVVYRARDLHLDRTVAIKVLTPARVADSERKRRFIQEAKSVSALNHPNIVTIHDIGSDQGRDYLAMEFVNGQTLDKLIPDGGYGWEELRRLAGQIAQGLVAAHAAGITHRDLKPSNIMLSERGQVKLLDFGLAKLTDKSDHGPEDQTLTAEGTIVGTVAYMSPEQAEGKKVDARSDIFSFGALLYEMASGRRAFRGDTAASTLGAVIHKQPEPLGRVVPRDLERLIQRCLRKDRNQRYQHVGDVAIALEEMEADAPAPPARAPSRAGWIAAGVMSLVAAGAGAAWWWARPPAIEAAPAPSGSRLTRLTFDDGLTTDPALWMPGKLLAYASDRVDGNLDIWVQQLAGGTPRRLTTDPSDDCEPSFSPDGSQILFRSSRAGGGIYLTPALGGPERKVAEEGYNPKFSPDGKWIAYWRGAINLDSGVSSLYIVPAGGGAPVRLAPGFIARRFAWSPDSKRILFSGSGRVDGQQVVDWFEMAVPNGMPRPVGVTTFMPMDLTRRPQPVDWSADSIVFSAQQGDSVSLWRLRIAANGSISGPLVRLTNGGNLDLAASVSGRTVAYAQMSENPDVWALPVDMNTGRVNGKLERLTHGLGEDFHAGISPDGRWVIYDAVRSSGSHELMALDRTTGQETSIVSSPPAPRGLIPKFSGDGRTVIYGTGGPSVTTMKGYTVPVTGGMVKKVMDCMPRDGFADGRRFLFSCRDGVGVYDSATGSFTPFLGRGAIPNGAVKLYPGEEWMSGYDTAPDGLTKIYLVPILNRLAKPEEWVEITPGDQREFTPEPSPDGRILFYFSERDGSRCLWFRRIEVATKRPIGPPQELYHFHRTRLSPLYTRAGQNTLSASRDRLVFVLTERLGNIWLAETPGI